MQIHPNIRKQIADLRKIPWSKVKHESAVVVELPIGQLSPKLMGRALYLTTTAFTELTHKQRLIVSIIHDSQAAIKIVLEDEKLTKEEMVEQLRKLILDLPENEEHSEESDS
tara:strand:- start:1096 stop:1431 length:336 start_codon:yes stop_codon:yes gene_type:complete